jgi:hypothetical protein
MMEATPYLLVAIAIALLVRMLRGYFLIFAILCLPGTIAHEFSHWITGLVTGAQPTSMNLIPERSGGSYVLGSVTLQNVRWYNGWLVGLSPLMLLPCAYYIAIHHAGHKWSLADICMLYLTAQLILASLPSSQDIKIAFCKSWWIFALVIFLIWHWLIKG